MKKAGLRHLPCVSCLLADIISVRVASTPRHDFQLGEESIESTIKGSWQRSLPAVGGPQSGGRSRGAAVGGPQSGGRRDSPQFFAGCGRGLWGQAPIRRCKTDCVRRGVPHLPVGIPLSIARIRDSLHLGEIANMACPPPCLPWHSAGPSPLEPAAGWPLERVSAVAIELILLCWRQKFYGRRQMTGFS
jgi:hypothetical protein